jgi:pilus assembly protein Flp/PilA
MHERASSTPTINQRKQITMIEYLNTWLQLKTDRRAVTALEYGIIAGVLGVVLVTIFTGLGNSLTTLFTNIETSL